MDLRRLRYFSVLVQELNFTRAARRLHIAQPALSQQIKILEREVGAQLIDRSGRRCALTPIGELVAVEVGRLLGEVDAAQARIRAAVSGQHGRLRLAYTRSARGGQVDALIAQFRLRYPNVEVLLQTGWTAHNTAELLADRLDAAFVRPPVDVPGIACRHVATEELLLAIPAAHRLARQRRISREAVSDEPVVLWPRANGPGMYDWIVRQIWFERAPFIVREEPDDEQLMLAVAAGTGIAPVPAGRARALRVPGVRLRRFTVPVPTLDIALAYPSHTAAPSVQRLIDLLDPQP